MRANLYTSRSIRSAAAAICLLAIAVAWTIEVRGQGTTKAQPAQAKGPAQAQAQPRYRELRADPQLKEWTDIITKKSDPRIQSVENMLSGASSLTKEFDTFFNSVVFPQFTRSENIFAKKAVRGATTLKATVCMLPDMRKDFRREFLDEATNRDAHQKLVSLTLNAMTHIAAGDYHPIARYNAMLLIAELDEPGGKPHPQALVAMVKAVQNPATIDAVRAASMVGIARHARAGIPANWHPFLVPIVRHVVTDNKRPPERSQEGHDWLRRRALEALTAMHGQNPPADGAFAKLLDTVLADTNSTMELRADAVEAFLTSKFVPPAGFDAAKFAAGIGQVAVDAYHTELDTSVRLGRRVYADGMTYYFRLVDKALEALDKAAPAPEIAKLRTSLTELEASTILEEPAFDEQPDPARELKLYDQIAKAGADFESLVTGKPVSEILPKRGKVGGNQVAGGGGYGAGGYGAGGGGFRPGGGAGYGSAGPRTMPDRAIRTGPAPSGNYGGAR